MDAAVDWKCIPCTEKAALVHIGENSIGCIHRIVLLSLVFLKNAKVCNVLYYYSVCLLKYYADTVALFNLIE